MNPIPIWVAPALAALLGLSFWGNVAQFSASSAAKERRAGEIATAIEQGRRMAAEELAQTEHEIAEDAIADREKIFVRLEDIAERGERRVTVFRDRIKEVPAATCGPGQERIDTWNDVVRGE